MMATSHMVFGGACWAAYSVATKQAVGLEVGVAVIASLLPDIDHPHSKAGRLVPFLSYPISMVFGHRGITHSLVAIIAMCVLMYVYGMNNNWIAAAIVGYLSHLVGDWLTGGVPLLWPYKHSFSSPVTIKTDSIFEPMLVTALLTGLLFVSGVDVGSFNVF